MAEITVSLTKRGRELEAQQLIYGYGFRIDYFEVGSGGHDPGNPELALPLNTDVTELPGAFFGPEPIDTKELITATCPRFTCILQPGEAVGGISNLGLVATVTYVPASSFLITPDAVEPGSSNKNFLPAAVNTGTDAITITSHGFVDGDSVVISSTTSLPTITGGGLFADTNYYIVNSTLNTFQLSLTNGGSPVDFTGPGSGTHTIRLAIDDTITKTAHGLVNGNEVNFLSTGTMPGGLVSAQTYFVRDANANTFKVSTILNGPPVDITTQGTGIFTVTNLSSLPPGAPVVGSTFLYALTNFPRRFKLSTMRETYTVTLQT